MNAPCNTTQRPSSVSRHVKQCRAAADSCHERCETDTSWVDRKKLTRVWHRIVGHFVLVSVLEMGTSRLWSRWWWEKTSFVATGESR